MSDICIVRPTSNFSMVPNAIFRDKNLSYKAIGLYGHIISIPTGRTISIAYLQASHSDGRDSILSGKSELEREGWLRVVETRNSAGLFTGSAWHITNVKGVFEGLPESDEPESGFPTSDNPQQSNTLFKKECKKEELSPEPEAGTGNTAPEDTPPLQKPDPLEPFPSLAAAYPRVIKEILRSHPKARFPVSGTKGDYDARLVLSQLVRVDGFTEDEILETFGWVFLVERPSPSGFSWREQFQSIAQLRNKKTGDTMHKFAKMHEAAKKAIDSPPKPALGEDLPEYIRDAMRAAGKL